MRRADKKLALPLRPPRRIFLQPATAIRRARRRNLLRSALWHTWFRS